MIAALPTWVGTSKIMRMTDSMCETATNGRLCKQVSMPVKGAYQTVQQEGEAVVR